MDDDLAVIADPNQVGRLDAGRAAGGMVTRPRLSGRLGGPARVTVVSAPPGSGKTVLLRSWISEAGLTGQVAWVTAGRGEHDPQRFWISVLAALRGTGPASALVEPSGAGPHPDGWATAERLLADLALLRDQLWLIIDDAHELSPDALRQLQLLIMRVSPKLRFVLATRHDVRLGLHRLRLEGEVAEIRADDLRFTLAEAGELFAAARLGLPGPVVVRLCERTEGWAAGLRLAALSLAGHPDPARFAEEFSGSERTVAEYLLAEVLGRLSGRARRLLLRTSVLERVNGELAGVLTGDEDGERLLQDLEQAGAFVVSLNVDRTWFRYHQMFAGLLTLELRRTAPGEIAGLHLAASAWFAAHGYPVEAIRHAQAARDWTVATRLLVDHWAGLYLDGQHATSHQLLAGFPARVRAADAELAAVAAADELTHGSVEAAGRFLRLAEQGMASVPAARRGPTQLVLEVARLLLARQRGDLRADAEAARRLQAAAEARGADQPGLGQDLRALMLTGLGSTGYWTAPGDEVARRLRQGIALARHIGRPFLESTGLAHLAAVEAFRSYGRGAGYAMRAVELAERHGWAGEPAAGVAAVVVGGALAWQGTLAEAEPWVQRAERAVKSEAQPLAGMVVGLHRAVLELGRGRNREALAAFRAAERLAGLLAAPEPAITVLRALQLQALVLLGDLEHAEQLLARLGEQERDCGELAMAVAALRLAQDDPHAAAAVLGPVMDGSAPLTWPVWMVQAFLLEAIARDMLGDPGAAGQALERALDLAESGGVLLPFLLYPAAGLLERHAPHRTTHAALIAEIFSLLAGQPDGPVVAGPPPPVEALSDSEIRVLRYLPTNLTAPEIARELSVSRNTVKTHLRNLYAKLGIHRRADAVTRARALGLLAPSAHSASSSWRRSSPARAGHQPLNTAA